ncbi:MAG: hypothetical protein AAGG51_24350 [Cyanobacteria bacterium P01_G01_bin.54]
MLQPLLTRSPRCFYVLLGLAIALALPACSAPPASTEAANPPPETPAATTAATNADNRLPEAPEVAPSPTPKAPQGTPLTPLTRLGLTGFGPIQVGMTIAEAQAATGMTFKSESSGGENYGCEYYTVAAFEGIAVMVTDGAIARIELHQPNLATISGATIGFTEEQVRNLYPGQIEDEPHEYVPDGKYLLYVPKDAASQAYRVIFETDATGKVTTIRSGQLPEVGYVEGCI